MRSYSFTSNSESSPDYAVLLPSQMPTSVHSYTRIIILKYPSKCLPSCPLVLYILAQASLLVKYVWSLCPQTYMASIMLIVLACLDVPCLVICSGKRKKYIKFIFMSLTLALTPAQVHWSIIFPKCQDKLYETEEVLWLGLCPWEGRKINNRSALRFPIVDFSTCFLSGLDLLGRKWCHQLNNVWEY